MNELTSAIPTESGHWYYQDGTPCHTIIGKNGKERNSTLRDARQLGLVPSVTSITKLLDRPGLNNWMQDQAILAALTLPRHEGEYDSEFVLRVKSDAREKGKKAAERGTGLHMDIERAIQGKLHRHEKHVAAISQKMLEHGLDLFAGEAEHSFAHPDGFGGKTDWHLHSKLADFKSKEKIEDGKQLAWDEHCIQIASYAYGLHIQEPQGFNIFVGIDDEKVVVHEWSKEELTRGLRMFLLLVQVWKLKNRIETGPQPEEPEPEPCLLLPVLPKEGEPGVD